MSKKTYRISKILKREVNQNPQRIMALSITIILILYWSIGKKIHPYTIFDSRKSSNYKKWSNWFLYGILGFIIFDVALAFILKLFYGV